AARATGPVVDAIDELRIPERTLYLFDLDGHPVRPATAESWIAEAARQAALGGSVDVERDAPRQRTLRLHGERYTLASGRPLVAVAVADQVELEHRYAALIAAFGGAALVALVLIAGGGSLLVRKSTAPIEQSIAQMRQFMADAAHELRTPLTVLRSRAEVTLQQRREPDAYVA